MGLRSALRIVDGAIPESKPTIQAQYAPPVMDGFSAYSFLNSAVYITRTEALAVPSVSRCHSLITGVIGSIELNLYKKSTGAELESPIWLEQPDYRQPRSVTISATVSDLFMHGVSFWEVTQVYADSGRPSNFAWVSYDRVTQKLNSTNTLVVGYTVDGSGLRPQNGLGSIVTFQALDSLGILGRGGRTIKAALDLEKASAIAAETPQASGYIQNSGADLPEEQITGLLSAWKLARQQRSTAYLSSTLRFEANNFSPKDMLYNEAKQMFATEIARLCNTPAYLLSADLNNSLTYSNVLDERRQFTDMTLMPFMIAIQERLSMDDLTARGNEVRFNVSESFLKSDALTRLAVIEKMLALNLITLDQAKEMEDLSPNGADNGSEALTPNL
jgi:HK97 family phage portal protein